MVSTKQASSTLLLLLLVSFVAILLYSVRAASNGSASGVVALLIVGPLTIYCVLSSLLFLVLYPFGVLNNYVYQQVAGPESPFASERLPTQIITPTDQEDGK